MRVALTVADFLDRAALVYGHRVAVVDEPDVPGSLGRATYAELEARARGLALALDGLGVGHGERVAIVSPNSGRFLTSFFGVSGTAASSCPSTSVSPATRSRTSWSTPGRQSSCTTRIWPARWTPSKWLTASARRGRGRRPVRAGPRRCPPRAVGG